MDTHVIVFSVRTVMSLCFCLKLKTVDRTTGYGGSGGVIASSHKKNTLNVISTVEGWTWKEPLWKDQATLEMVW